MCAFYLCLFFYLSFFCLIARSLDLYVQSQIKYSLYTFSVSLSLSHLHSATLLTKLYFFSSFILFRLKSISTIEKIARLQGHGWYGKVQFQFFFFHDVHFIVIIFSLSVLKSIDILPTILHTTSKKTIKYHSMEKYHLNQTRVTRIHPTFEWYAPSFHPFENG